MRSGYIIDYVGRRTHNPPGRSKHSSCHIYRVELVSVGKQDLSGETAPFARLAERSRTRGKHLPPLVQQVDSAAK